MIFKPELVALVLKGKKTATRRIANGKPCRYQVGQHYAVQPGRGKPQVARITILDVERQALGELTYDEAIAEGFRTRADFARYWLRLHEPDHEPNGASADELLERWLEGHGHTEVWAIRFELKRQLDVVVSTTPLYLHRKLGVTTDPSRKVPGEPEVLDGVLRTSSVARARREAEQAHQRQLRDAHRLLERTRAALAQAITADVDVKPDLQLLERHVEELEEKLRAA